MGVNLNVNFKYPETERWFNGFGHGNVGGWYNCSEILIYSCYGSVS
jgi:hypothetical protein